MPDACEGVRKPVKMSVKVSCGVKLCQKVSACYVMAVCDCESLVEENFPRESLVNPEGNFFLDSCLSVTCLSQVNNMTDG